MRKLLLAAAVAAALVTSASAALGSSTKTIKVRDDFFSATKLTVAKGTLVTWKWSGTSDSHNVRDSKRRFGSKTMTSGSFSYRFRKAGTYTVRCTIHPTVMRTRITVR